MWKILALCALVVLAAVGGRIDDASAQAPPAAQPREAAPPATADKPEKTASPRKRKTRHATYRHTRRYVAAHKCFGHEWRPFPTRDPKGYFYAPAGGGIC